MKRDLVAVLLVLLTAWVPFTLAQAPDEAVREAVVLNPDKLSFYRIGTAFHVGGGAFYTNAHVVRAKVPDGYIQWYLASTSSSSSRDTWLGPAIVRLCPSAMARSRRPESFSAIRCGDLQAKPEE